MTQPGRRPDREKAIDVEAVGPGPYRIHVAAKLSGVASGTLRAWERRYGVPVPRRTAAAYRLYTSADVALVRRMRELVDQGVAPSEAAKTLLASSPVGEDEPGAPDEDLFSAAKEALLAATMRWDGRAIDDELLRLSYLVNADTLFTRVISPLLVDVGNRCEKGLVSIAQEHLVSEKIELVLRGALRSMERGEGPHVLLACLDGETHVIGLLGAALRFALNGWRVTILGASTPPPALGEAIRGLGPQLVGLSATGVPSSRNMIKQYALACGKTPWVVGGPAASRMRSEIERAGGIVAPGASNALSAEMREWLRGSR